MSALSTIWTLPSRIGRCESVSTFGDLRIIRRVAFCCFLGTKTQWKLLHTDYSSSIITGRILRGAP
jgi:hypothetical protein